MAAPTLTEDTGCRGQSKTTGTTVSATYTSRTWAVGDYAVVQFTTDPGAGGTVSFAFSTQASNFGSWSTINNVTSGSGTSGVRAVAAMAKCTTGFTGTAQVTVTHPSVAARAVAGHYLTGADGTTPTQGTATATGQTHPIVTITGSGSYDCCAAVFTGSEVATGGTVSSSNVVGWTAGIGDTTTYGTSGGGGASNSSLSALTSTSTAVAAGTQVNQYAYSGTSNATIGVVFVAPSSGDATASPAKLAVPVSFPAPAAMANATASPAVLACPVSFPQAVASLPVIAAPAVLAAPASFPAPAAHANATASPAVLAAPAAFPGAGAHVHVTATPAVLAAPAAFPAAAARVDVTAAPTVLACPVSFPAATASAGLPAPYEVAGASAAAGSATLQAAISHDVALHDTVLVFLSTNNTLTPSVTDSKGNTYTQVTSDTSLTGKAAAFICLDITTPLTVAGGDWVQGGFGTTAGTKTIEARARAGLAGGAVDVAVHIPDNAGNQPSIASGALLAAEGEWAAAFLVNTNGAGVPSGWAGGFTAQTSQHVTSNQYATVADRNCTTVSRLATGATITTGSWWVMLLVSVKPATSAASYPSRLRTSGQGLVDANGVTMPLLKGFCVQAQANWAQSDFDAMAAKGAKLVRTVVFWDQLEPDSLNTSGDHGHFDATYVGKLDTHISRVQSAGMYSLLAFYYGPGGTHCPAWAGGSSAMGTFVTYGQAACQYLANRYGSNPVVIGMGINEVTPDSTSGSGWLTTLITQQVNSLVAWMRSQAPAWIASFSCGWGASAPYANAPGSGHAADTYNSAQQAPTSNFAVELHDYFLATKDGSDGRTAQGTTWSTPGGPEIKIDDTTNSGGENYTVYPPYTSGSQLTQAACQADLAKFLASYAAYCATAYADCPLLLGEMGWVPKDGSTTFSGGDLLVADKIAAWGSLLPAAELQWDYNTSTASDPWAARPGAGQPGADSDGWLTWTNTIFGGGATATPAVLACPVSFPAPAPSAAATASPAVLAAPASFPGPAPAIHVTATPAVLAAPASFPAPAAHASGTVTPAVLACPVSFPAPSVQAGGTTTATPAVLACPASFPAAAASAGATAAPAVLAAPAAFPAPQLAIHVTAAPTRLAAPAAFPAPAAHADVRTAPAALSCPVSFPAPGVTTGGGATATPSVLACPVSFPAPTVRQDVAPAPATLAAPASFPAAGVSASAQAAPAVLASPASFPAPSVTSGGGATATPAVLACPVAFPAPIVRQDVAVTPVRLSVPVSFPAAQARVNVAANPPRLLAPVSFPALAAMAAARAYPALLLVCVAFPAPDVQAISPAKYGHLVLAGADTAGSLTADGRTAGRITGGGDTATSGIVAGGST